jgi:hypothetical protein
MKNPTTSPRTTFAKLPFHGGQKCYACAAKPIGFRDRRPEGGDMEVACKRHADPRIATYDACQYCNGPVQKGSLDIDGLFAHQKCHEQVCDGTFEREIEKAGKRHEALAARAATPPLPVDMTVLIDDGTRVEIAVCPTRVLKGNYAFADGIRQVAIGKELELRGWTVGFDGPRITWTRTRTFDWKIVEHISGVWSYHMRDAAQPAALSQPSACGKPVMTTHAPLSTWGLVGHLREKYCPTCAARAELTG